jgi:dCTP deaminase
LLSDRRIMAEIARGNIVIDPFSLDNLGTNSYDLRLGNHFYRQGDIYRLASLDPYSEQSVRTLWQPWNVDVGDIVLRPGETVLAHTEEFVGGRNGFVGYLRARSSIGRLGITVANCAGMGDVGYVNRWTMEMTNHLNIPVTLRIHTRVAQMVFFEVGNTDKEYRGKYQSHDSLDLAGIKKAWSPEQMLPKLWKDPEMQKLTTAERAELMGLDS